MQEIITLIKSDSFFRDEVKTFANISALKAHIATITTEAIDDEGDYISGYTRYLETLLNDVDEWAQYQIHITQLKS